MGHRVTKAFPKQPTYGCQVTIQSKQEKQLQKMFHKEDKKMMKKDKGAKNIDDIDKESYLAAKGFVPELMRQERCVVALAYFKGGDGIILASLSCFFRSVNCYFVPLLQGADTI